MKAMILAISLALVSCSFSVKSDPQPPFNESEGYLQTSDTFPGILEPTDPTFIKNVDFEKIKDWIEWTKNEIEKAGQLDNAAREKLLKDLKVRLIILGLSEEEADEFVTQITPKFERLVRAIIANNKVEIAVASASILVTIIPIIIVIIRRRRRNKK